MQWKKVSNQNSNTIDNIEDKSFNQSSEEKDIYLEYMIDKVFEKTRFQAKRIM